MACTQVWVRVFIVSTSVKYQEWCHWKGRTTIIPSRKRRQNVGSSCIYTCKLRRLNDMLLGALEIFQQRHYSGVPWASRHLNNSKKNKQTKKNTTSPITYITGHFLGHVANLPLKLDALQWRNDGPRHLALCGEFTRDRWIPRTYNAENVSIWWRHHADNDKCRIRRRFELTNDTVHLPSTS